MKGYKFYNNEIAKRFINKYEIKDSKIVLHMNNKDTLEYQYSDDTVIKIAEMQLDCYDKYNEEELKSNKRSIKIQKIFTILLTLSTLTLGAVMLATAYEFMWSFLAIASATGLVMQVVEGVKTNKNIKELEKQRVYISMVDDLDNDTLDNNNISQCLSNRKINKMNKQKELTGATFNLTSIDKLSLDDLKKLRDNIEREKEFGFDPINKTKQYGTKRN